MTRPDVQTAMTVIGRRRAARDRDRVDLTAAVLPASVLFRADLTRVRLAGADLTGAVLYDGDLSRWSGAIWTPHSVTPIG